MPRKHTAVIYALIPPNVVVSVQDIKRDASWNGRAPRQSEVESAIQCLCRSGRIVRASRGFYARSTTPDYILDWHRADIAKAATASAAPGIFKREQAARAAYLEAPSEKTLNAYRWAKGLATKARREKRAFI